MMNKKITMFSIALIIAGIIGSIGFSISSMPYFIDTVSNVEKVVSEESVIFNKEVNITKVNLEIENTDIVIKRHNNNNILVTQSGNKDKSYYKVETLNNELSIKEEKSSESSYKAIKDLNQFINYFVGNLYENSMVIYLPQNVDINALTNDGTVRVEEDVILNNITFKTQTGQVVLPKNSKDIDKLDITSMGQIRLSSLELLGIKEINISSNLLNIYSNDEDIFIDNIEKYIPETLNIVSTQNYDLGIYIDSDIPLAKTVSINSYKDTVYLDYPFEKYNTSIDFKASDHIYIDEYMDNELSSTSEGSNISEIKKEIKNDINKDAEMYKLNIKAREIQID